MHAIKILSTYILISLWSMQLAFLLLHAYTISTELFLFYTNKHSFSVCIKKEEKNTAEAFRNLLYSLSYCIIVPPSLKCSSCK